MDAFTGCSVINGFMIGDTAHSMIIADLELLAEKGYEFPVSGDNMNKRYNSTTTYSHGWNNKKTEKGYKGHTLR